MDGWASHWWVGVWWVMNGCLVGDEWVFGGLGGLEKELEMERWGVNG